MSITMGDPVQNIQARERILDQIPATIHNLLQGYASSPIRILGDMPNRVLDPGDYPGSTRLFVSKTEESIHDHHPDIKTCYVAANILPGKHSYFVLDVNNVDYDYETAHTNTTLIPVYVLRLSMRKISIFRKPTLDATVAERIREMHDGHGYDDPLPLFDDYNRADLQYANPRSFEG